jgi:ABC-type transporter lipoprotein component MlaA
MRSLPLHSVVRTAVVLMSPMLGACAANRHVDGPEDLYQVNDPLEPVNRGIFTFNLTLDDYVIKPTAVAYRDYIPEAVRNSIHNFLTNLRSPVIMFNGRGAVAGIDLRSRNIDILDRIRSTSLDYYATIRSIYSQRRASVIRHEIPPEANPALSRLPDQGAASNPQ